MLIAYARRRWLDLFHCASLPSRTFRTRIDRDRPVKAADDRTVPPAHRPIPSDKYIALNGGRFTRCFSRMHRQAARLLLMTATGI
jgi:hypothetical protein